VIPEPSRSPLSSQSFIGVSLSGGRQERSVICELVEYEYPRRLVLYTLLSAQDQVELGSPDEFFIDFLKRKSPQMIVFDSPLSLPSCFQCHCLTAVSSCSKPEVRWLLAQQWEKHKKPRRYPTPYTQRALDFFLENYLAEKFEYGHALGSNWAPITVRVQTWLRFLGGYPLFESPVKIVAYYLGRSFGLNRLQALNLFSSTQGLELRQVFLEKMQSRMDLFFYERDLLVVQKEPHAFQALLAAYMGLLSLRNQVAKLPNFLAHEKCLLPKACEQDYVTRLEIVHPQGEGND